MAGTSSAGSKQTPIWVETEEDNNGDEPEIKAEAKSESKTNSATETDLRILLVGKTGHGKTRLINALMGRDFFVSSRSSGSVTRNVQTADFHVLDTARSRHYNLKVVDTPGIMDTQLPAETVEREIASVVANSPFGFHAICVVISMAGRMTEEEGQVILFCLRFHFPDMATNAILVFTHGDLVTHEHEQDSKQPTVAQWIEGFRHSRMGRHAYHLVENRTFVFNGNRRMDDALATQQRMTFLDHLHTTFRTPYTCPIFKQAQDILIAERQQRHDAILAEEANKKAIHNRMITLTMETEYLRAKLIESQAAIQLARSAETQARQSLMKKGGDGGSDVMMDSIFGGLGAVGGVMAMAYCSIM